jgi:hypothetical protein
MAAVILSASTRCGRNGSQWVSREPEVRPNVASWSVRGGIGSWAAHHGSTPLRAADLQQDMRHTVKQVQRL